LTKNQKGLFLIGVVAFIAFKIFLIQYYPSPIVFADEGVYFDKAYDIFKRFDLVSKVDYAQSYPPLYSIVLSVAFIFNNIRTVFAAMQVINILLNASIILLSYLILKEYIQDGKAAVYSFLVGALPSVFPYSYNVMSENLYTPLLLLSAFLLIFAVKKDKPLHYFPLGLTIGLMYMTRSFGIVHIIALLLTFLVALIWDKQFMKHFKNTLYSCLGILTAVLPYRIFISLQGRAMNGISSDYEIGGYVKSIISWFTSFNGFKAFIRLLLSEIGFTAAACFVALVVFFFLFAIRALSDNKNRIVIIYSCLSYLGSVIITIAHMTGPFTSGNLEYLVFGRYIDPLIPLVVLFGLIGFDYFKKERDKYKSVFLLLFTVIYPIVLLFLPLENYKFPNMYSIYYLYHYSSGQVGVAILLMFLLLMYAVFYLKKTRYIAIILLVALVFANYPTLQTQSMHSEYYANTLNKVGFYLNNYKDMRVTMDRKGHDSLSFYLFRFWNPSLNFKLIHLDDFVVKEYPGELLISANPYPYKVLFSDTKYTVYDMGELAKDGN
jgi:4-amino-4-deoxy-L-arabinose transferase-like glycosyltransferase